MGHRVPKTLPVEKWVVLYGMALFAVG